MSITYTVSQAAKLLGTSTATVRRMADDMAEILPDYQPIAGQARKLSTDDLKVLSALHSRLNASPGLTRSALLVQLSDPNSEPLIIPDSLPAASPPDSPDSQETGKAIQATSPLPDNALAPFLPAQDVTQTQIAELSARIEMLSADRPQPTRATPLVVASLLSVGALIVAVTVSALFQWPMAGVAGCAFALFVLVIGLVSPSVRT